MSGALNVIAGSSGGMVVTASPDDVLGIGSPTASAGPVSVTIIGGRAPYYGEWIALSGDSMSVSGGNPFFFSGVPGGPGGTLFANYIYRVTDSSSPPLVKDSQTVFVTLQGSA